MLTTREVLDNLPPDSAITKNMVGKGVEGLAMIFWTKADDEYLMGMVDTAGNKEVGLLSEAALNMNMVAASQYILDSLKEK